MTVAIALLLIIVGVASFFGSLKLATQWIHDRSRTKLIWSIVLVTVYLFALVAAAIVMGDNGVR